MPMSKNGPSNKPWPVKSDGSCIRHQRIRGKSQWLRATSHREETVAHQDDRRGDGQRHARPQKWAGAQAIRIVDRIFIDMTGQDR